MKTPEELRALLDALPRPLQLTVIVQVLSERGSWYTAQSPEEARYMIDYMQTQSA